MSKYKVRFILGENNSFKKKSFKKKEMALKYAEQQSYMSIIIVKKKKVELYRYNNGVLC